MPCMHTTSSMTASSPPAQAVNVHACMLEQPRGAPPTPAAARGRRCSSSASRPRSAAAARAAPARARTAAPQCSESLPLHTMCLRGRHECTQASEQDTPLFMFYRSCSHEPLPRIAVLAPRCIATRVLHVRRRTLHVPRLPAMQTPPSPAGTGMRKSAGGEQCDQHVPDKGMLPAYTRHRVQWLYATVLQA